MTYLIMTLLAALALGLSFHGRVRNVAANIAEGTHNGILNKRATAPITTRHLLMKFGATADLIAVNGANDYPLGPCPDEAEAANDIVPVHLLGVHPETQLGVASEAIAAGGEVYTAAGGKLQDLPVAAGTYYKVGLALTAAGADEDVLEYAPCTPVETVVS